jgi:PAS domain S-box-containing protein
VSALSEGVLLITREGKISAWNRSAERILGLSGQQIGERGTLDPRWRMVHEDGSPFVPEARPDQQALQTGLMQQGVVMGVYKPDGTQAWIAVNAVPVCAPGETLPATVVVSFSDIGERRRMQGLLENAVATTERLLQGGGDR